MQWQPIDTAPRDGTMILISSTQWKVSWQGKYRQCDEPGVPKYSAYNEPGWTRIGFMDIGLDPTHWQEMPQPPTE